VKIKRLDWAALGSANDEGEQARVMVTDIAPKVILAADVVSLLFVLFPFRFLTSTNSASKVYDPEIVPPLADCLSRLLGTDIQSSGEGMTALPTPSRAYVAGTIRNPETWQLFLEACSEV